MASLNALSLNAPKNWVRKSGKKALSFKRPIVLIAIYCSRTEPYPLKGEVRRGLLNAFIKNAPYLATVLFARLLKEAIIFSKL